MTASVQLKIHIGATFRKRLIYQDSAGVPISLAGGSAITKVVDVDTGNLLVELSTANGGIVLNAVAGSIDYFLDAATTGAITWVNGAYDILLTLPGGDINKLFKGAMIAERTFSV